MNKIMIEIKGTWHDVPFGGSGEIAEWHEDPGRIEDMVRAAIDAAKDSILHQVRRMIDPATGRPLVTK